MKFRDLYYWQKYQKNEPKTEETLSQAKKSGQGVILEELTARGVFTKLKVDPSGFMHIAKCIDSCASLNRAFHRSSFVHRAACSASGWSPPQQAAGGQVLLLHHPLQVVKHYYYTHCRWSSRRGRSSFWKSKQQVAVEWALQSGFCVLGIEARSKAGIQQAKKYCKCVYRKWVMQCVSTKVGNARCMFKIGYCKWMQVVKQ